MADFGASGSSAMNPTNIVPVLLSIKFFDGDEKDDIYYHYFFSPPPFWVMSQHGWQAFAVVETPLLLEDEQWKREYFLDRDIKDILSLTKESLMEYYGSDAENLGLGPRDKWVTFVTEHDGVEVCLHRVPPAIIPPNFVIGIRCVLIKIGANGQSVAYLGHNPQKTHR